MDTLITNEADMEAESDEVYMCGMCGGLYACECGMYVDVSGTEYAPIGVIFAQSDDAARYKYACRRCQRDEGLTPAALSIQTRLRRQW